MKETINSFILSIQNGYCIVWYFDELLVAIIKDGKPVFLNNKGFKDEKHLVRMRVFNIDKELHIWRSRDGLKSRVWDGEEQAAELSHYKSMIVVAEVAHQVTQLGILDPSEGKIGIRTENAISINPETQMAGYSDSRFVEFVEKKPNK